MRWAIIGHFMERIAGKKRLVAMWLAILMSTAAAAGADEQLEQQPNWYVQAGGYVHFDDDEDFEGTPWFAGVEYQRPSNWVVGLSVFNNSFGDISQYAYLGKSFHPSARHPGFRLKLTGGIAHGYRGENHDALPVRWGNSWGFGIIPGAGYQSGKVGFDVAFLGESGLLFLFGYEL
jgi:hypothetical protein